MKQPLVLHICCAPDEAWVVSTLRGEYALHCFFCNPNISPQSEYDLRLSEARKVASYFGVPFTVDDYEPEIWSNRVAPWITTPEGGMRCQACFNLRLQRTARFCDSIGWADFTTVMSISPHKRIEMLNIAGKKAAAEYALNYHCFNFKKQDGFRKSILLSSELGLYRQDYCGCYLSRDERDRRKQKSTLS